VKNLLLVESSSPFDRLPSDTLRAGRACGRLLRDLRSLAMTLLRYYHSFVGQAWFVLGVKGEGNRSRQGRSRFGVYPE